MDNYDENVSRITAMASVIDDYHTDSNMVKIAEIQYEKLRQLNRTAVIQVDLKKSVGNIIKRLSIESIWKSPKDAVVSSAIQEARSTVLGRAVGPLEELPIGQYMEDSVRRIQVATHTQVGPEQRLIAKLVQMKGNDWNTVKQYGGLATYLTEIKDVQRDKALLNKNLKSTGNSNKSSIGINVLGQRLNIPFGPQNNIVSNDDNMRNKWYPEGFGTQYGRDKAAEIANNGRFPFKLTNLASGIEVSFPPSIANLNESMNAMWGTISLINRSEDLYVYERADRTFTFDFTLYAVTDEDSDKLSNQAIDYNKNGYPYVIIHDESGVREVPVITKLEMWNKINFLHTLTRPLYSSTGRYEKAPYCKIYLGDLYKNRYCIFDNINVGYEPLIWDIGVDQYGGNIRPMIARITMNGKILGNTAPDVNSQFYG